MWFKNFWILCWWRVVVTILWLGALGGAGYWLYTVISPDWKWPNWLGFATGIIVVLFFLGFLASMGVYEAWIHDDFDQNITGSDTPDYIEN